jgi:hypothetical protein|tara:strand:+ start:1406 stop:1642 length:237 start_codon:yes stop_codon:yes gene_type:complete
VVTPEFAAAAEVVGRIWSWEARGVYLAATVEDIGPNEPSLVLGIVNEDRLNADDHAWLDVHHASVLASVVVLSELTIQ